MAKGIGGTLLLTGLLASVAFGQDNGGAHRIGADVLPPPALVPAPGSDLPPVPPVWQPEPCRTIAPYLLSPYPPPPIACPEPPPDVDGPPCIWFSAEYLVWWIRKGPESVPLVTTSSADNFGILGRSDTAVLFGGSGFDYRAFSGARFNLGFWCNDCQSLGIEGSGFFLERRPAEFDANSSVTGVPVIARPLINALNGQETAELVSWPGAFSGSIQVRSTSGIYGFDVNAITGIRETPGFSARLLAGFRYLHLDEDINIIQDSTLLGGGSSGFPVVSPDGFGGNVITAPASVHLVDRFHTTDQFYGGQVGVRAEYRGDWFCVDLLGKVAIGDVHQEGEISGLSSLTVPNQPVQTVTGGVLALSSNIGRQVHDQFSVVPELGVNIGCRVTRHLTAYVGYSVLYWTDVARPGELINRTVNPTLLPTSQAFGTAVATAPAQPTSSLQHSDFWAQGVNFGLEFRY